MLPQESPLPPQGWKLLPNPISKRDRRARIFGMKGLVLAEAVPVTSSLKDSAGFARQNPRHQRSHTRRQQLSNMQHEQTSNGFSSDVSLAVASTSNSTESRAARSASADIQLELAMSGCEPPTTPLQTPQIDTVRDPDPTTSGFFARLNSQLTQEKFCPQFLPSRRSLCNSLKLSQD